MKPEFQKELCALLPETIEFPYFPEREASWLLSRRLAGPTRIGRLRRGPEQSLLDREGVRDVVANCGDGMISPERLKPLADPIVALAAAEESCPDKATETALDIAVGAEWREFSISFGTWAGHEIDQDDWRSLQISRQGGNLVLRVNFPTSFTRSYSQLFSVKRLYQYNCTWHPVDQSAVTMAWARLDLEPWGQDVLVEEIQTDWLRAFKADRERASRGRSKRHIAEREALVEYTMATYSRDWARVVMLATLQFVSRDLGARRVWFHQFAPGARLKFIRGDLPPRSLYTDLPRRFGFAKTDRAPDFLYRARSRVLSRLRRRGAPLFWRLDLDAAA